MAEYVIVPAMNVRVIPATIPADIAAAFSLATLTAWRMVVTRAQVRAGERVLIWGIGGGVAIAALQICKQLGAYVSVTSGSDVKLTRARALGADETINHRTSDVTKVLRERTAKRGVDVVIDDVGVATWKQSLLVLVERRQDQWSRQTSADYSGISGQSWDRRWATMPSSMSSSSNCGRVASILLWTMCIRSPKADTLSKGWKNRSNLGKW